MTFAEKRKIRKERRATRKARWIANKPKRIENAKKVGAVFFKILTWSKYPIQLFIKMVVIPNLLSKIKGKHNHLENEYQPLAPFIKKELEKIIEDNI